MLLLLLTLLYLGTRIDGAIVQTNPSCGTITYPVYNPNSCPPGYRCEPLTPKNVLWDDTNCTARCANGYNSYFQTHLNFVDGIQYTKGKAYFLNFNEVTIAISTIPFFCAIRKNATIHTPEQVENKERCDTTTALPGSANVDCFKSRILCRNFTNDITYTVAQPTGECSVFCKNGNTGLAVLDYSAGRTYWGTQIYLTGKTWKFGTLTLTAKQRVVCLDDIALPEHLAPKQKQCCGKLPLAGACAERGCQKDTFILEYVDEKKEATKYSCEYDDMKFVSNVSCGYDSKPDPNFCTKIECNSITNYLADVKPTYCVPNVPITDPTTVVVTTPSTTKSTGTTPSTTPSTTTPTTTTKTTPTTTTPAPLTTINPLCGLPYYPSFNPTACPEGYECVPLTQSTTHWDNQNCTLRCKRGLHLYEGGFFHIVDGIQSTKKGPIVMLLTPKAGVSVADTVDNLCAIRKREVIHTPEQINNPNRCDAGLSPLPTSNVCTDRILCTNMTTTNTYTVKDPLTGECRLFCKSNNNRGIVAMFGKEYVLHEDYLAWNGKSWFAKETDVIYNKWTSFSCMVDLLPPTGVSINPFPEALPVPPKTCCGRLPLFQTCEEVGCELDTFIFQYADEKDEIPKYSCEYDNLEFLTNTTCGFGAKNSASCEQIQCSVETKKLQGVFPTYCAPKLPQTSTSTVSTSTTTGTTTATLTTTTTPKCPPCQAPDGFYFEKAPEVTEVGCDILTCADKEGVWNYSEKFHNMACQKDGQWKIAVKLANGALADRGLFKTENITGRNLYCVPEPSCDYCKDPVGIDLVETPPTIHEVCKALKCKYETGTFKGETFSQINCRGNGEWEVFVKEKKAGNDVSRGKFSCITADDLKCDPKPVVDPDY